MELSVLHRLLLLGLLPAEGTITTLRIVRQLREDLSFSEEEHALLELTGDDKGIHWKADKAVSKDVDIGAKAHTLIADVLTSLSTAKKLRPEHLDLYDLFVEEKT